MSDVLANISIGEASVNDVESIRRMQARSWCDTYQNDDLGITKEWLARETESWFDAEVLSESKRWLSKIFTDSTQFYRVARKDNDIIGLIHASTRNDGERRLEGLYIDKSMHGTGLAQEMMSQATEFLGDHEVELEVISYNERAKAFYKKFGFEPTDKLNELYKGIIPSTTMIRTRINYSKEETS
jgi:RimJ/RimL family protein N-acetyltransferase